MINSRNAYVFTNEIISDCEKASLDDLLKLEQEYDFIFPDELKFFYTQYNGGKPQKRIVCLQDGEWKSNTRFHGFYTVNNNFEKTLKNVNDESWWIKGFIPFGYDEGGETFCFSTRNNDYGCIYYFMSDCIDDENPEDAYLKVSENFLDFINNMKS